ncbi:MAG: cupin domain-containing protein [Ruminococcaceae bacterium]|nr:cupin domain-containing protein [Oscillospiraceae bacterium]
MNNAKVIDTWRVKPLVASEYYDSRMILDSVVAGAPTVNINEGTLHGGGICGGGSHEKDEIYYVTKGHAHLHLNDDIVEVQPGSLIFIPAGTDHKIVNASQTEDFKLLTIWLKAEDNDMYNVRLEQWGKSFKYDDED